MKVDEQKIKDGAARLADAIGRRVNADVDGIARDVLRECVEACHANDDGDANPLRLPWRESRGLPMFVEDCDCKIVVDANNLGPVGTRLWGIRRKRIVAAVNSHDAAVELAREIIRVTHFTASRTKSTTLARKFLRAAGLEDTK